MELLVISYRDITDLYQRCNIGFQIGLHSTCMNQLEICSRSLLSDVSITRTIISHLSHCCKHQYHNTGDVTSHLWLHSDPHSTSLIGAAVLNRTKILTSHGLVCSIKTRKELIGEQRAVGLLKLLGWIAGSCDLLCDRVSGSLSEEHRHMGGAGSDGLGGLALRGFGSRFAQGQFVAGQQHHQQQQGAALRPLLRNDLKLPYQFVQAWHSLLLTLLAVPNF